MRSQMPRRMLAAWRAVYASVKTASLQLLGGVHHAHEFPDEDVALAVHQLVARLGQHPGALGGDQVALGGQQIGHGG